MTTTISGARRPAQPFAPPDWLKPYMHLVDTGFGRSVENGITPDEMANEWCSLDENPSRALSATIVRAQIKLLYKLYKERLLITEGDDATNTDA